MVQVDIPFSFGVGALMATAVEHGLRSERRAYFYQLGLAANLVMQTLCVLWLPLYLLVSHFGFQTSHMWWHGDALTDHTLLLPIFIVVYFAASIAGYHTGARLVEAGRSQAARAIFVGSCVFFAGWMALQPARTLKLGTYREWVEGRAVWMWQDGGFMTLLGVAFVLFVAAQWGFYRALASLASQAGVRSVV
ncbi:MAG: hypothetical protein ACRD1U_18025 [Vicinamibacterales bacterium]